VSNTVITPPGRISMPRWRELWEAREVFYRFGQRDVVLRYRQTAVGVAWVLIQPLVSAGIFSMIFGNVAQLPSDGVPYFLFAYVGMLAWNLFSGVVSRASSSLVSNQALVAKVFFPRMLVPLSTSLSVLVDFVVAFGLYVVLVLVYGAAPGWQIALVIPMTVLILTLGLGIGLAASAIMVKYRDVAYVLPWLLQIGLYATPVAYSLSAVPPDLEWLFMLNPLTWVLESFRYSLLGTSAPPTWQVVASIAASILVFLGGVLVFQKNERTFADLI